MIISKKQRQAKRRRSSDPRPSRQLLEFAVDSLERRLLLTTTFFFDFGAGLAASGLNTNVDAFRDVAGANTGTDLAMDAGMNAGDALNIARLNYDFDGNGTAGEVSDMNALAAAVVPLIQRALEPFDIDVVIGAATSLADVAVAMAGNAGDASGEFDAYNFVTTFTSATLVNAVTNPTGSVGVFAGLFGLASRPDFNLAAGNFTDEATQSYADTIFTSTPGGAGSSAFNQNLAQRMAYTATHEAAHTMGLRHSTGLEASGDVIRLGSNTRNNPFIVTRFDLNKADGPPVVNNFDLFANDLDIGLRDGNANGTPDLAYISGTGAHDLIEIDANGATMVDVLVSAFSNSAMTSLIASEGYSIDLNTDTEGTILIDGSINADLIDIDGAILAIFRVRGGIGLDGISSENDIMQVDGDGNDALIIVGNNGGGILAIFGGATINFSEIESLDLNNFGQLDVTGANGDNDFVIRSAGVANDFVVTVDGFDFNAEATSFVFAGLANNDTLTIDNAAGLVNRQIDYAGGSGFDSLIIEGNPGFVVARETYLVGASEDAGTWILDPNDSAGVGAGGVLDGDELVVTFSGLSPVDTSTAAVNFDIFLTDGIDIVLMEAGGLLAGVQSTLVDDLGGTFETFRYANKQNVTLDALGGDDVITSSDNVIAAGELSRALVGSDGNDTFNLGGSDLDALGGMGNDVYNVVTDAFSATIVIHELLGEGSDTVDFSMLAMPAMATEQSGVGLAMAGSLMVEVGAPGQQKNIEFGINAAPFVNFTVAPPLGVPFMTQDFEVEYADVGTMSMHTALFDWGDGNSDPGVIAGALGMGVATASHQFDDVGDFNIIATIFDDEGLSKNDLTMTTIQQFALLPDQKNPALTALYVGATVGPDVLKFRQLGSGDVRAVLNGVRLGNFTFDGGIFAYGGSGNDVIVPVNRFTKNLTFEGGGDVDFLKGSDGDDMLFGQGGKDTIFGAKGNDMLVGGDERDHIYGNTGDDMILGGLGNDVIAGGAGIDFLDGGSGNDVISGNGGADILLGRGNKDTLTGGGGDDVLVGGSGVDTLSGGGGNDLLIGTATTHDADPSAWEAIRDEWVFSAAAIPGRISNIMLGGGLNGANVLVSGVTIFDDGSADILTSGGGTDWYLVFPIDNAKGVSGVDFVTML